MLLTQTDKFDRSHSEAPTHRLHNQSCNKTEQYVDMMHICDFQPHLIRAHQIARDEVCTDAMTVSIQLPVIAAAHTHSFCKTVPAKCKDR